MPKSYQNEAAPADSSASGASDESGEPDFGLGIGDILRSDVGIKRARSSAEASPRSGSPEKDAQRLSIDAILRGESLAEKPRMPASLMEDDKAEELARQEAEARAALEDDSDIQSMDPPRERGGFLKSFLLFLLVLVLFVAAAGGVYMFLSKNGVPSFIADHSRDNGTPVAGDLTNVSNEPTQSAVPESASVVVLVGTKAPATEGAKPFLLTRAIESDGKTSGTFPATGEASSKTDFAVGRATIINTTGRGYTFVATTRLLSKEGVLFRMVKTTSIPANGSVEVDVKADQPGAEGDIGPTTFTIPGLPVDQQKLITAKSDAAMTGGSGIGVKGVSQTDIDAAKTELSKRLRDEALDNFEVMLLAGERLNGDMVTSRELAATAPKVGTAGETFPVSLSLRFTALLMPEKDVTPLLETAMVGVLPAGVSAVDYSLGSVSYTVQAYDTAAGVAEVRIDAPIIRR